MVELEMKEALVGGRVGKIHKIQDKIIRPVNKWTEDIHHFLRFLHEEGADFVPKPHGINENEEEVLSFVPGDVFNSLPEDLLTDTVLISAAKLLLKFHVFSEKYISRLTKNEQWMLPVITPIEVMCHGDFAPYNVTMIGILPLVSLILIHSILVQKCGTSSTQLIVGCPLKPLIKMLYRNK